MCLMVTADHGPAVSGAHNTIVCARAGKDLVSSLASGLLTIVCYCRFKVLKILIQYTPSVMKNWLIQEWPLLGDNIFEYFTIFTSEIWPDKKDGATIIIYYNVFSVMI